VHRKLLCLLLAAAAASARMTVEDVVRLANAGVSEEIILEQIRSQHQTFDLTADQLIQLKQAHVSERVMKALMTGPANSEAAPHPSAAASRPAPQLVQTTRAAAASASPVVWTPHTDPMGFSVNLPAGWDLRSDRSAGRIAIQGPQGQRAVIWPMFIERQQIDQQSAGALVKQLAERASPEMAWGAPAVVGSAARVLARGTANGVAIMHWNALPDGTAVYLSCVTAPASLYRGSVDIFAGILNSFHVTPAANRAPPAAAPPAPIPPPRPPLTWTRWTDPREGAFGVSIPQGWSITGGSVRQSATDIRKNVVVLAPDGQIRIRVGDDQIGAFAAPHAMYGRAGLRTGMSTSLGDGTRLEIRRFEPASQFLRQYLNGPALRDCPGVTILSESERPDLGAESQEQARAHRVNVRITTSAMSFSCTWNGRPARGYYAAATVFVPSQMGGLWYVDPLYGFIAAAEREKEAEMISRHVYESMQVNSDWKRKEDQMAADAVRQDNERAAAIQAAARKSIAENQQATSDMIVKGYQARSQTYDEIARRRENSILGTVDVVDPTSGKQYKVDNYSDYHWMNNQGTIAGTKTDSSPGYDWHEMITLP